MPPITESDIEQFAISLLKEHGYSYMYAPDMGPDSARPERGGYTEVILTGRLQKAIERLNPKAPASTKEEALKILLRIKSPDLTANNETFHRYLTEGITTHYNKNGDERGEIIRLVDFDNPENNDFLASNQFTIIEEGHEKRADVILFVNGLPLVLIELKNPADENATVRSAYKQVQTYKAEIPGLFTYNGFIIISDGLEAKAGTLTSEYERFMTWKTSDGKKEDPRFINQLETLIKGMLNPYTLLDLIKHFTVFEKTKKEDGANGQTFIITEKKLAAYHQYYAVNAAVQSTLRASGYINKSADNVVKESPESYGVKGTSAQPVGDRKGGVIWHTQGSGKSLSMVFYTGKIVQALENPTVVVITDRNDLDDQLFETFASSKQLLRQEPGQALSRTDLKERLKVASGGIVFTTIQKFMPENDAEFEVLSERENIVVIVDEAHRSQYGFARREVEFSDKSGRPAGVRQSPGFAANMRKALSNATYIGFTGTPIEKSDRNTPAVFGNYIDIYDIKKAVEDGATVPIYYESRLAKIKLSDEGRKLVQELDEEIDESNLTYDQHERAKWAKLEAIIGSKERIENIAKDVVSHFEQRREVFFGKAMIVCMSRRIAVELYNKIVKLRPLWHSDDLKKGALKIVMTAASSDGPELSKHHTTKSERKTISGRMKDPDDELNIVIVCDMWLTGFDVPILHTMYIDKPMKGHNLMQAIARVNRVYGDKPGGLIVDYIGIASELKEAVAFYADAGGRGEPAANQERAIKIMLEKLETVSEMLHGFPYEEYFGADVSKKLSIILSAEDFLLSLEDGKKKYIKEVIALSRAFALAIPNEQALYVRDEVAFFQAVKARLAKFNNTINGKSDEEIEFTIRQIIDKALVTDKVIDIYDAAGIKKPDISILSDEFLMEIRNMDHKNVALETLKKLLNDEIRAREKVNLVESRSLLESLENTISRYHNKIITAVEVIEELINLGKEIVRLDKQPEELNLSKYEYAFYTAVADNKSALDLMGKEKLRELAAVIFEKVKQNASIDWTLKESVKAKLKVIIKRTLRQYGYPPDMQSLATETVLKQAELIASELTKPRNNGSAYVC
jgi:type I restriction enzyme R subunit